MISGGLFRSSFGVRTPVERSCALMVEEELSSEAKALEPRFASVVDAERARLLAIGEGRQELRQPHVGAMLRTIWPFSNGFDRFLEE
jgi:hypothetical protein